MAGYSGTPLAKKLGIRSQFRVAFFRLPPEVKTELEDNLAHCRAAGPGPLDFVMIFVKSQAELRKRFPQFARQLAPAGMLWVSWPKKSSGVTSDVAENDVRVRSICRDGYCEACSTRYVSGKVDHRDSVLDENDRKTILQVCVSRAMPGEKLVLDL